MTTWDTLVLDDFNAHHSCWHATSTDTRGKNLADAICNTELGIHYSSHETRYASREARKKSQKSALIFTTAIVTSPIKSCSNSRAFGLDLLSIFHIKNLGLRAIKYLTHRPFQLLNSRSLAGYLRFGRPH